MKDKYKESCINCDNFAWWDGDYCCIAKFLILQNSPKGKFTEEILKTMKTSDDYCENYSKVKKEFNAYEEPFNTFLESLV